MARSRPWTLTTALPLSLLLLLSGCPSETDNGSGGRGGQAGGGTGTGGRTGSGGSSQTGSGGSSQTGSGGSSQTGGGGGAARGGSTGSGGVSGGGGRGGAAGAGDAGADSGAGGTTGADSASAAPKLSVDVLPIIKMNCARAGCHDAVKMEHKMNLSTAATAYVGWVNYRSFDHCRNNAPVTRVVPGKPDESFVVKLISTAMYCNEVKRMPPPPFPQLTPDQVKVIRDWIAAGALND